ncbi:MAG: hypothetical protein WAM11_17290 [Cyanobium sp.]
MLCAGRYTATVTPPQLQRNGEDGMARGDRRMPLQDERTTQSDDAKADGAGPWAAAPRPL